MKPLPLRIYHKLLTFIRNSKINIMRSLGYGCENCKHCEPVCWYGGEISGVNFWCKHWEYTGVAAKEVQTEKPGGINRDCPKGMQLQRGPHHFK